MSYVFPDHSDFADYKIPSVICGVQPLKCITECVKVDQSCPVIATWKEYESFVYFNGNSVLCFCASAYVQKFSNQL